MSGRVSEGGKEGGEKWEGGGVGVMTAKRFREKVSVERTKRGRESKMNRYSERGKNTLKSRKRKRNLVTSIT